VINVCSRLDYITIYNLGLSPVNTYTGVRWKQKTGKWKKQIAKTPEGEKWGPESRKPNFRKWKMEDRNIEDRFSWGGPYFPRADREYFMLLVCIVLTSQTPYDLPFSHNTANVKKDAMSRFGLVSDKIPNVWVLSQSPRNASWVSSRFRISRAYPCWTPQVGGF